MNTLKKALIALFCTMLHVSFATAASLDGTYKFPKINGINIPAHAVVTGTSNGYSITVGETFEIPFVGCTLSAGFEYVRLISQGGDLYTADVVFPKINIGKPDHCSPKAEEPETVRLVEETNGITLDFISSSQIDQFFERVGTPVGDTSVPTVTVKKAKGKAGSKIKLKFQSVDDSGQTADVVLVILNGKVKKTFVIPLGIKTARVDTVVTWSAPKNAAGKKYTFQVVSTDASGNISATAIGNITIQPAARK